VLPLNNDIVRGRFISFEGGEGAGKSTQVRLLADALTHKGIRCLSTREPGGSPGAESIRELLIQGDVGRWDPMSEALLNFAARRDHVTNVIEPALCAGTWVICDRFTDSTIAYQGFGQGLEISLIQDLHRTAVGDLWPDVTFILDIPVADGFGRVANRSTDIDRYERMDSQFHIRLREGFLEIARKNVERCAVVDAQPPVDVVHQAVITLIEQRLGV
jgi:dTMP kinase